MTTDEQKAALLELLYDYVADNYGETVTSTTTVGELAEELAMSMRHTTVSADRHRYLINALLA